MGRTPIHDLVSQTLEPGPAVFVVQRDAAFHLLDIFPRMEVVSVGKLPAQLLCQQASNQRLSGTSHAHHDHNHERSPATRVFLVGLMGNISALKEYQPGAPFLASFARSGAFPATTRSAF